MKLSRAALLATALVAAGGHAADPAPALLSAKLTALAGAGARDCGSFPLRSDLHAAIACANAATSSGDAYRLAVQLPGNDSTVWQGAARDAHGKLWVVFYDLDASGGAPASPTLSLVPCREIVFALRGEEVLDCQPYLGQP
jgi:hypothetical protein